MLLFVTHVIEEDAELWVGVWVNGGLEHREENVLQHFAKVGDEVPASEDIAKIKRGAQQSHLNLKSCHFSNQTYFSSSNVQDPGHLNHPLEVRGEDSVFDEPVGQLVPLTGAGTIDGETGLSILVLGIFQVIGYFLSYAEVQIRFMKLVNIRFICLAEK